MAANEEPINKYQRDLDEEITSLLTFEPENDDGDTEYKRMLVGKSRDRIDELETQMRYRMEEGNGQCTYIIGVDDDGSPFGLTEEQYSETRETLEKICQRNDYSLRLLTETKLDKKGKIIRIEPEIENPDCGTFSNPENRDTNKNQQVYEVDFVNSDFNPDIRRGTPVYEVLKIYEFLIRENNTIDYEEVKIAMAGNVDAAKSSSVGTLISGQLDDGRGSARLKVLNYKHEVDTGRSSSISQQILGYEPDGTIVNHDTSVKKISWPEISARSSKIIKFFDLCGHEKYSKTTIRGMTANSVDYAFITIGSNMGLKGSTREHIGVCLTMEIPIIILLTKIDLGEKVPGVMEETISQIKKLFSRPGSRKMLYNVKDMNDVITVTKSIQNGDIVPMFRTSNTRGDGLGLVHEFLNMVRPRLQFDPASSVEMHISETFTPRGIGLVVGGFLKKGTLEANTDYWLGPIDGTYKKVKCRSLHVNRIQVQKATPGRYVCVSIPKMERKSISRGMVLVRDENQCRIAHEFLAEITVYRTHHTTIRVGYETMIHVNALRTTVRLVEIVNKKKIKLRKSREAIPKEESSENVLSLGDRAVVRLKFAHKPCYVNVGDRILLAECHVKMSGRVLGSKE